MRPHKENGYFYKKLCKCNTGFYRHEYVENQCIFNGGMATVPYAKGECPTCWSFYYFDRRKPLKPLEWFVRLTKPEQQMLRLNLNKFQNEMKSLLGIKGLHCTFSIRDGVISFFYDSIFWGREPLSKLTAQRVF
jgi:hypothetical protein